MARNGEESASVTSTKSQEGEAPVVENYRPVRWLLSGTIAGKLQQIIKGAFISNELNLRDWMAFPHDSSEPYREQNGEACNDVWFDFIADTGDDSRTMEVMAACFSQDIKVKEADRAKFRAGGGERAACDARLGEDFPGQRTSGDVMLPRGAFLFMGGDTAYVVADETTIHDRVVAPFNRGHSYAHRMRGMPNEEPRPLFGIPGNHDYYDELIGFNRMFRKAPPRPPACPQQLATASKAPLQLDGFRRVQDASYMRIQLPGTWELWGTDFWNQPVDYRQRAYFRPSDSDYPRNLIVCTPTPPIVFGGDLTTPAEKESYARLLGTRSRPEDPKPEWDVGKHLRTGLNGQSLLLLSGDKHHYARYQSAEPDREPSMICVVSGGGGAFLHPTETDLGTFNAKMQYLSKNDSRKQTARGLAVPGAIFGAGLVWLIGAVLAWLVAASAPTRIVHEFPSTALRFWLIAVVAVGILVGVQGIVKWFRLQRLLLYAQENGRTWQDGKKPSGFYTKVRKYRLVVWARRWGGPRFAGAVLRFAVIGFALTLHYLTKGWWLDVASVTTILFVGLAILITLALGLLGFFLGGAVVRRRRLWFAALGVFHAAIQLGAPLLMTRYAALPALAWIALIWTGFGIAGWALYKRGLGAAVAACVLWVAQILALVVLLPFDANPHHVHWAVTLVCGAIVAPIQFSWYLLVAGCFDGHNNEIGVAMRSTQYKQWIRFHITPDKVTGYVISIDRPLDAWGDLTHNGRNPLDHAQLRDVFTLHATPPLQPVRTGQHAASTQPCGETWSPGQ